MPKLNIKASHAFETNITQKIMQELSLAISKSYGCFSDHVWVSWEVQTGKRWLFEGEYYLENQLAYIDFDFYCFRASSNASIPDLLKLINERISLALPESHVFGSYTELKAGEAILNEKVLDGGV